ncbi:hypothetical protein P43SY_003475 [Pythium insidiosum]|uniref:Pirin C-terminal domain-containing protein n=1 Tax=Pythium insidiosum TaxID=114742 RepID=A0AAD5LKX7_PYTIN|nr:hypothetical protein P43SY_003475 [Pythium insidiosum]
MSDDHERAFSKPFCALRKSAMVSWISCSVEIKRETVPHAFSDDKSIEAIVFAGEAFGQTGPIQTEAPVTYIHFILRKGATLRHRIPHGHNAFIYALRGHGVYAADAQDELPLTAHQAVVLQRDGGDGIHVTTHSDDGVEFIVVSGEPLHEPVVQHGPFVMTTEHEIHETIADFRSAQNGFKNARSWSSDIAARRFRGEKP